MIKYRQKQIYLILAILLMVIVGFVVSSQAQAGSADTLLWGGEGGNTQASLGLGNDDPRIVIARIIRVALGFLGIIALVIIIYAGWLWMSSAGDPQKIDLAKKVLTGALIGLIIILLSFAIASFVINQLYRATTGGGGGGGTPTCTAANVGQRIGCNECKNVFGSYEWVFNSTLSGCSPTGPVICDEDTSTGECDINNLDHCDDLGFPAGTYYCDPTAGCTCQPKGGLGDPCDGDLSTTDCDANDNLCQTDLYCEDDPASSDVCTCVGAPVIDYISPTTAGVPNGAPGNFVTVGGRYFGTFDSANSKVFFSSAGGIDVEAQFPSAVEPRCTDFWSDNQIIVIVPDSAVEGQIRVQRSDLAIDDSGDGRGPVIPDFVINSIVRPGLCLVENKTVVVNIECSDDSDCITRCLRSLNICAKDYGKHTDLIDYVGINLNSSPPANAYFGAYSNYYEALFSPLNDGSAGVPDLTPSQTTTFASSSNEVSNFLNFRILVDSAGGPYISYFDPITGNEGQYVTIFGGNFGPVQGASTVEFAENPNGFPGIVEPADFTFPDVCAGNVWSDNMIIVKVPDLAASNPFYILITVNGATTSSANVANDPPDTSPTFAYDTSAALAPSLCRIYPVMGPHNNPIQLFGEYFGASPDTVIFTQDINMSGYTTSEWQVNVSPIQIGDTIYNLPADRIASTVPQAAETGPVKVKQGGETGNGINFKVGLCTDFADGDAACGHQICCPPGTHEEGRCKDSIDECSLDVFSAVYEFDFNTGVGCPPGSEECGSICCYIATGGCADPTLPGTCANCPTGQNECSNGDCCAIPCVSSPISPAQTYCPLLDSCSGVGLDQCLDLQFCPNSPGACRVYPGGQPINSGNCNFDCSLFNCTSAECYYDNAAPNYLDRCVQGSIVSHSHTSCDFSSTTRDIVGNPVNASCRMSNNGGSSEPRWHMSTGLSCPPDWEQSVDSPNTCVYMPLTCANCQAPYVCINDHLDTYDKGVCAINQDICPSGYVCDHIIGGAAPNDGICTKTDNALCECCCEFGQDTRDCCYPTVCEGSCGDDLVPGDDQAGTDWGECSRCWIDTDNSGDITPADQAASDLACNCEGHTGKYCDLYDPNYPQGVCRDCARLFTPEECTAHSAQCCVDGNTLTNACRGEPADHNMDNAVKPDPTLGYCPYFNCNTGPTYDCDTTTSTKGIYRSQDSCEIGCGSGGGGGGQVNFGVSCASTTAFAQSVIDEATDTCDESVCPSPFQCLQKDGGFAQNPFISSDLDPCGICCCDPDWQSHGKPNDDCESVNTDLKCQPGVSPCTTDSTAPRARGLCCGCEEDTDCVPAAATPSNVGCGYDTCCRARPSVTSVMPADQDNINVPLNERVCRNIKITATFDQRMDISSFSGNMMVIGDYGANPCPEGTQFLVRETPQTKNKFARILDRVLSVLHKVAQKILPTRFAKAFAPIDAGHVYCAVPGSVTGRHDPSGQYGIIEFNLNRLLDKDTYYYAVILGDENLDSKKGVRSQWGIGMNGIHTEQFNSMTFSRSRIWGFRTLGETAPNDGICEIDHVVVEPRSYLFQTTVDNPNEDDDPTNPGNNTYDTVSDRDKEFMAFALSADNQLLAGVPGYRWNWNWTIPPTPPVVDFDPAAPYTPTVDEKQLIQAIDGVTDDSTTITATVKLTESDYTHAGDGEPGHADVYVFICENPWPPVLGGIWAPWSDSTNNCDVNSTSCDNFNFQLYYCRDSGGIGPADDLPAISSSSDAIIRGTTKLCSGGGQFCDVHTPCPGGETCEYDIFKEIYFFRESEPAAPNTSALSLVNTGAGGAIQVLWDEVSGADGYRLYWGTSPDHSYDSFATIEGGNNPDSNFVSCVASGCHGGNQCDCTVTGLTNNTRYYFNITSYTTTGGESEYIEEVWETPTDTTPPNPPSALSITPLDGQVEISWTNINPPGVVDHFMAYMGTSPSTYGDVQEIGDVNAVKIGGLTNGTPYYFVIGAVDAAGNESRSGEVSAIPDAVSTSLLPSGTVVMVWSVGGGVGDYEVYLEVIE